MNRKPQIFFILLFSILILPNLGTRTLWQDEAETALVAKQMVTSNTWLPYAQDEQGPISQDWNYQFSVSPLWRWHPWLQFYLAAISFKLLGISIFAARLPFAIIGIIALWYSLEFLRKYGPKKSGYFFIGALFLLTCAPLLLHFRQCRYYAPTALFTLMALDGYLQLQKSRVKYILGSIFLFHSFLPGALTFQIACFIHALFTNRQSFLPFLKMFFVTLFFTVPWALWLHIGGQNLNFTPALIWQHIVQHYVYINKFIFPFYFIPLLLFRSVRKIVRDHKPLILFAFVILCNTGLYTVNHPYFFRYLVPLIPLFTICALWICASVQRPFAVVGIALLFLTNVKTFPNYLFEITHPYNGTNEQLISFIQQLPSTYHSLAINYDDFTFRFHTPLTVYGPQHLPTLQTCPDMIVIYPTWGNEETLKTLANSCSLQQNTVRVPFIKLADDPSPVTHQFEVSNSKNTVLSAIIYLQK